MGIAAFFTRKIIFTLLAVLAFGIFTGAGAGESFLFGLLFLGLSFGLHLIILLIGVLATGVLALTVAVKARRAGERVA